MLVDLEDAVAPAHKDAARANVVRLLADLPADRRVQVRVNHPSTPWHEADVAALAGLPLPVGVRMPKVESAEEVLALAAAVPGRGLHPLIESALGVERALQIATASPQVASIGLGEADLRSDLGVDDEAGLTWARSRVIGSRFHAALKSSSRR